MQKPKRHSDLNPHHRDSKERSFDSYWNRYKPDSLSEEEFRQHLKAATPVLRALDRMIEHEIVSAEKVTEVDYDNPSWSHKQAHQNGIAACARKIRNLLPDQQER